MTETAAALAGYTHKVMGDSTEYTLELYVKPDADLDDRFPAICAETGDRLSVNGWLFVWAPLDLAA